MSGTSFGGNILGQILLKQYVFFFQRWSVPPYRPSDLQCDILSKSNPNLWIINYEIVHMPSGNGLIGQSDAMDTDIAWKLCFRQYDAISTIVGLDFTQSHIETEEHKIRLVHYMNHILNVFCNQQPLHIDNTDASIKSSINVTIDTATHNNYSLILKPELGQFTDISYNHEELITDLYFRFNFCSYSSRRRRRNTKYLNDSILWEFDYELVNNYSSLLSYSGREYDNKVSKTSKYEKYLSIPFSSHYEDLSNNSHHPLFKLLNFSLLLNKHDDEPSLKRSYPETRKESSFWTIKLDVGHTCLVFVIFIISVTISIIYFSRKVKLIRSRHYQMVNLRQIVVAYDVYICYSSNDSITKQWIQDDLIPELNRTNVTVCDRENVLLPGMSLQETEQFMTNSRQIIVVLGKDSLEDPDFLVYELPTANAVAKCRSKHLIVVKINELRRNIQDSTVNTLLMQHAHLTWNENRTKQKRFWRKLERQLKGEEEICTKCFTLKCTPADEGVYGEGERDVTVETQV